MWLKSIQIKNTKGFIDYNVLFREASGEASQANYR
jgi:hypothetical protein